MSLSSFLAGAAVSTLCVGALFVEALSGSIQDDFNARASASLAKDGLSNIAVAKFKQGVAGCAAPLYGAAITAKGANGEYVEGTGCISARTEFVFTPKGMKL